MPWDTPPTKPNPISDKAKATGYGLTWTAYAARNLPAVQETVEEFKRIIDDLHKQFGMTKLKITLSNVAGKGYVGGYMPDDRKKGTGSIDIALPEIIRTAGLWQIPASEVLRDVMNHELAHHFDTWARENMPGWNEYRQAEQDNPDDIHGDQFFHTNRTAVQGNPPGPLAMLENMVRNPISLLPSIHDEEPGSAIGALGRNSNMVRMLTLLTKSRAKVLE